MSVAMNPARGGVAWESARLTNNITLTWDERSRLVRMETPSTGINLQNGSSTAQLPAAFPALVSNVVVSPAGFISGVDGQFAGMARVTLGTDRTLKVTMFGYLSGGQALGALINTVIVLPDGTQAADEPIEGPEIMD